MTLRARTLEQFLVELASKAPSPGGGAVAATTAATAAALAGMVVNYSFTKKLAAHHDALRDAAHRLERARALLLTLADEDAAAYNALSAALKLDKADPARPRTLAGAALAATQVPLSVMAATTDLLRLLDTLADKTNPNLRSDLLIAAMLAETACRAADHNVRVNLPILARHDADAGIADQADAMLHAARDLHDSIQTRAR